MLIGKYEYVCGFWIVSFLAQTISRVPRLVMAWVMEETLHRLHNNGEALVKVPLIPWMVWSSVGVN